MTGFNNTIIGGAEKLIRKAIQSPNYVAGLLGWTINKDGSAEFNNGVFRGALTIGPATGPQVKILSGAGIPVSFVMHATGSAPTDVTSVSNLQQVIEFPTNNANEVFPPVMGEVTVTFSDGSVSDGYLVVAGFDGTLGVSSSTFTLIISDSTSGVHSQCSFTGQVSISGGAFQLTPLTMQDNLGNQGTYINSSGQALLRQTGVLVPGFETWTAFNPLSNGWAVNAAYSTAAVRLVSSPRGCIQFDALMNCSSGIGAVTTDGTIIGNVPARFRPLQTKTFSVTCDVLRLTGANSEGPRFSLDSAGNIKCFGIAAAATQVSLNGVLVALDTN